MFNLKEDLSALEDLAPKVKHIFPSYITHIRFPHFKNMSPGTRIDFSFPITALVGANGSGKTSVLHALYGTPNGFSTGEYWFSTQLDPINERQGNPNRFIYGHYNREYKDVVETRKARVKKSRGGVPDPNYWEPTKEAAGDGMVTPVATNLSGVPGRSKNRWNPVNRKVVYINFRKELSAFDKYFYFGKDPKGKRKSSKKDQILHDAKLLAKVIASNNTSVETYGKKIAVINRLLTSNELEVVSFVLGRKYREARLVRHRLFKGEDGLSIKFNTEFGEYSEAFAGSGEVAVTSCVIQILEAKEGTLILLDEPEVSLHPGAQERLLAFLANRTKEKKLQVVFSTHSPHLIGALPDHAIKPFTQLQTGKFAVLESSHPYAAFRRLGDLESPQLLVLVEDRLAAAVVEHAIYLMSDASMRDLFRVEFMPGGASALLCYRIPFLMNGTSPWLVLLDGDQKKAISFQDPIEIPESNNQNLVEIIRKQIGCVPYLITDGGKSGGNERQKIELQRDYLKAIYERLRYLPLSNPEELILKAMGTDVVEGTSSKSIMSKLVREKQGQEVTSEDIDNFASVLLALNRDKSKELLVVRDILVNFVAQLRPASNS